MAAEYPVLAAAIEIDSTNNVLRAQESVGSEFSATITAGTYYLDEPSGGSISGNFAKAIKAALDAGSPNVRTYTVTPTFAVDGGAVTCTVTLAVSAGTTTFKFASGSNTFDASLIGFPQTDSGYASTRDSTYSPLISWCSNQPAVISDPSSVSMGEGLFQHISPGGKAFTYKTADPRAFRRLDFEYVASDRAWQEDSAADTPRTFESFWRQANDGRAVRIYTQSIASGTDLTDLTTSELKGTYVIDAESIRAFQPERTMTGLNLYGWSTTFREYVS